VWGSGILEGKYRGGCVKQKALGEVLFVGRLICLEGFKERRRWT
jgi:hypothetical protein